MSTPGGAIAESHDYLLAALSALVAVLALYTAANFAERAAAGHRGGWYVGGAVATGIGILSMHGTGLLTLRLPEFVFHWPTVLLAFLIGFASSVIALFVVSREKPRWPVVLGGGIFLGTGMAALRYLIVASLRPQAAYHYSPSSVVLSVLFAIAGSLLWITFFSWNKIAGRRGRNLAGALLSGAALFVMHYTGMAAVSFTASAAAPDLIHTVRVTSLGIALIVTAAAIALPAAIAICLVDRLRERGALLYAIFEQAPEAIALIGMDAMVLRVNREFTHVFGYTPQEAVDRNLFELIAPGDLFEGHSQCGAELVGPGQRVETETLRQRKDGTRLHVLVVRVPVSLPFGKTAVFAMYRNIAERKETEKTLRTLSGRLMEVQERERQHLARELHDEIGQLLTGLRLLLRLNGAGSAEAHMSRSRVEQARAIVDDLLARVRSLSFDLRPADLDQLGLLPALQSLFERLTAQTGVLVDFKQQGLARRFSPQVETGVFRVVQGALTNVARHAGVAGVTAHVWADAERLNLLIEDRGSGFDPETALKSPRSSGLIGMRERIALLGGQMTIESSQGNGTTIAAELPLGDAEQPKGKSIGIGI